jgi:hypothetical protein
MLSLLKADCTFEDIETALEDAANEVAKRKTEQQDEHDKLDKLQRGKMEEKEKVAAFIRELTSTGISRNKALKAFRAVGADDPVAGN